MSLVRTTATIDLADADNAALLKWCEEHGIPQDKLPEVSLDVDVEVEASELADDEIIERYDELTARDGADWLERVYRLLAEGDCNGAMDCLQREFDLPPVAHARAIADLLSPVRASHG